MANPFTAFKFQAAGTGVNTSFDMPDRLAYRKNVAEYGTLGDGTGALLNTRYGSLAAAQVDYPFVTNIATQTIDWAGIMGAFHWNDYFLTTTASNQTASFTGQYAVASFTGTIVTNALTVSAVSGTVAVGQTISGSGVTACQIVSGSGTSWVVNGSPQTVGPVAMTTNCVLLASSVSGTIVPVANLVTGGGQTTRILSQFSGTTGKDGSYVIDNNLNLSSQPMLAVSQVLTFGNGVPAGLQALAPAGTSVLNISDLTSPTALVGTSLISATSTSVTLNFVSGLVSSGDSIAFIVLNKGTIVIPPGNYVVNQTIDIGPCDGITVAFLGTYTTAIVIGSFADYVFKKANPSATGPCFIENLSVINNDANGGGIRLGGCVGAAIRNCVVVANRGINNAQDDSGSAGATSLEFTIENCSVSPGSNPTDSYGIMTVANGPVLNCRIVGYANGVVTWGQEGNQIIAGCYFEGNQIGFRPGWQPSGVAGDGAGYGILGCRFKNNGTAMLITGGATSGFQQAIHIEADESVMVFGAIPQYGIELEGDTGAFYGIMVTGQYEQAAISVATDTSNNQPLATFWGVNAFNTSTHGGVAWIPPTTAQTAQFKACNCPAPVYGLASLPVGQVSISSITWDSGTGLSTITVMGNISQLTPPFPITVIGMSPSGYNGTFTLTAITGVFTATYSQSNPGAPSATGSGIALFNNKGVQEGDCYNVNDSNSSTWGATPISGSPDVHAKVRWSIVPDSNWTVVGI